MEAPKSNDLHPFGLQDDGMNPNNSENGFETQCCVREESCVIYEGILQQLGYLWSAHSSTTTHYNFNVTTNY